MIGGINTLDIQFGGKFKDYLIYHNDNFPFYGSVENYKLMWHIGLKSESQEHLILVDNMTNGKHKLELGTYSYVTNKYNFLSDTADLYGELKEEFDGALSMLYNIRYKALAYVGSEPAMLGTNHYVLCSATQLIPNTIPYPVIIGFNVYNGKGNVISVNVIKPVN